VPARTVLENVFLGSWANKAGFVRPEQDRQRFKDLTDDVGFHLQPDAIVGQLSMAQQQQIEVLRALARKSRLVIMDEPTAVLTDAETNALLDLIRRLAKGGVTVVLVSHSLNEVLNTCDTVTVLRDGNHVLTEPTERHTSQSLVNAMVGQEVEVLFPPIPPVPDDAPVVLAARDLRRYPSVRGVSLEVKAGEILGLAGLVGSGRSEVARLIFGADRPDRGQVWIDGNELRPGSPSAAMKAGVAMVPESRKEQGLILSASTQDNVTLASLDNTSVGGLRRPRQERRMAKEYTQRLDVRGADPEGPVWTLSGGNQQKVLFAKWLSRAPLLLIIDEPTRGVDVGAKVQIHRLIAKLAGAGIAILLISSEIEEVLGLCHRIVVLRQGRISGTFDAKEASRELVLAAAFQEEEP
jgi:ribose transport system ATP-binding protein